MHPDRAFDQLLSAAREERLSRRAVIERALALGLGISAVSAALAACGPSPSTPVPAGGGGAASPVARGSPESAARGTRGGTLKIAMVGNPPTLDIHQTTGTIVSLIGWNMFEPLFTWDEKFQLIPMLAESHEVSGDQLTNTVKLRQSVPFHNGQEMKAADVVASIQRWATKSGLGKALLMATDTIATPDDYTLQFKMKQPYGSFAPSLAQINQGCAIYPKSVIDATGDGALKEFVGTGPYKFVSQQPDRLVRLARFDNYAALPGEPRGYGGHKYAYVDQIDLTPVPDEAARVAGLQSMDYDYPESISPDQYETLKGNPNIVAEVLPPLSWGVFLLNMKQGPMANQKLRQAFQAALDHTAICEAGYGKGFYRLSPSIMFQETAWYTEVGKDLYDQHNPDKAKQLLKEAGYDGTPIHFTCTKQYLDHYNRSIVAKQQLEAVGFSVNLDVFDWATILTQQQQPDKWDVTTTGITFRPDPTQLAILDVCNFAGWWCTDSTTQLVNQLRTESDFKTRYAIWEKIQQNFYTEVPMIKVGDALQAFVRSKRLQGLSTQNQLGPILWNVWLST